MYRPFLWPLNTVMYCKQGIMGAQFSHTQRGHALCCASFKRYDDSPKTVWHSKLLKARQNLSNNIKIKDCTPCYEMEDKGIQSFRQLYNGQFKDLEHNNLPQHLDLDLSNFCNLKCVMCDPSRSSMWAKELGRFTDNNGVTSIADKELDEICELSYDLKHLTLQGGEPSIIQQYITYFQFLKDNNILKNIHLNVVTNLTNVQEKFYSYLPYFKNVNISVSVDAYGQANDYIRYPSNFEKVTENIKTLTELSTLTVKIDTAIQILSMFNIKDFIEWFNDLYQYFEQRERYVGQYIQHVHTPAELCILNAPLDLKKEFEKQIQGSGFEYLTSTLYTQENYDYSKTINYLKPISTRRNINIDDYIPNFKLYY